MRSIVAIVGRPNVGKSTLFNRIVGGRRALVDDMPGVTRDRHYAEANWVGYNFLLIDTGGITDLADNTVEAAVTRQSMAAINEADVVCCVFDGREGLNSLDEHIIAILRKSKKPVVYVVNKIDSGRGDNIDPEFFSIGAKNMFPISAEHGRNIDEPLDAIISHLEKTTDELPHKDSDTLHIAVIGRPNVGKSTLVNYLLGEDRVVVHDTAGTTRDMIDVEISVGNEKYIFVDTAGIKRRSKTAAGIEKFSTIKSLRAVERADIVLLVTDATEGFTHQDASLLDFIFEERRAIVCLSNKCDLVKEIPDDKKLAKLRESYFQLHNVPIVHISAKTGKNCSEIYKWISRIKKSMDRRLSTSELNTMLEAIISSHHLPVWRDKMLKLYYISQVDTWPPTFVVFANFPEGIPESYKRYLQNRIYEEFGLGVPIVVKYKKR